jgi:diadenosine tetraphosphate (Ap4A) HIT family hydrolase
MGEKREERYERYKLDEDEYIHMIQTSLCFICRIVAGTYDEAPIHLIYEDNNVIAFLERWPRLYGWALIAPRKHREQVTGDFTLHEYLTLHNTTFLVSEAIRQEVGAERMYIASFGSNQAISHVHWLIIPLPSDTPFREQQNAVFRKDILKIPEKEMAALAKRLRQRIKHLHEKLPSAPVAS